MRILIPVGGVGQRFKDEGYEYPKPLINVLGKPMIVYLLESLDLSDEDEIQIIYNSYLTKYNFENVIKHQFQKKAISFHCLEKQTKGPSETVLIGLNSLKEYELDSRFLVLDCDTFYNENILSLYKNCENGNSIFYFTDNQDNPIFSYLEIDKNNQVLSIEEKKKISENASTGAYGFSDGHILKKYCEQVLNQEGELYMSNVYKNMIEDEIPVKSIKVNDFNCVGTPIQLKLFCSNNLKKFEKLRFCFDLDNTLVSYPTSFGDYSSVTPIYKNIEYLRYLKNSGHYVIIYTARRMKTHNGNLSDVISDIADVTIKTLEKFNIPYDELIFGKPYAHFYIDDLAVNSHSNLEKFIGIYDVHTKPRNFNEIFFFDKFVKKKTNNDGECFWYKNIPNIVKSYFPSVLSIDNNEIIMEKIDGVTFSYLFINNLLTTENISKLISEIKNIHNSSRDNSEINIYENYKLKLQQRYYNNIDLYRRYDLDDIFIKLIELLSLYENNKQGKKKVIHGDLVFTNILLDKNNQIKFIDMRGKMGDKFTIFGDVFYDYAKIYQSLVGYDFIINNTVLNEKYQTKLIKVFEKNFSEAELNNIKIITASLLFSLLPLHEENKLKFFEYIKIIRKIIL